MLNENNLYLLTNEKQRLYLTGFFATDGYVVVSDGKKFLFVDPRYFYAAQKALKNSDVTVVKGFKNEAFEFLKSTGKKDLYIDYTKTSISEAEEYGELGFSLKDCSKDMVASMKIKSDEELKNIKKACAIAEASLKCVLPLIKEGISELELAAALEAEFKKHGASNPSFETIVAFGKNAAVPHHETGDTKLKYGECVLMDFGCLYKGYCSDMTRTMFYGEPTEPFKKAYLAVLTAHMKAAEGIKEGMTGKEADGIARNVLSSLGYGKYFTHSLGHGIGVNIHEYPYLSPKGEAALKNNMVFSNEPGVYLDGKFGIRIEDSCHLENGKYKTFMKDDKSLIILGGDGTIKREKLYR